MNLRLTEEETAALRAYAEQHDQSMQEAAREAIRQLVHNERVAHLSQFLLARDRELLDRLGQ